MKRCPKCGEKYVYITESYFSDVDGFMYKVEYGCSMCGHEWTEEKEPLDDDEETNTN